MNLKDKTIYLYKSDDNTFIHCFAKIEDFTFAVSTERDRCSDFEWEARIKTASRRVMISLSFYETYGKDPHSQNSDLTKQFAEVKKYPIITRTLKLKEIKLLEIND